MLGCHGQADKPEAEAPAWLKDRFGWWREWKLARLERRVFDIDDARVLNRRTLRPPAAPLPPTCVYIGRAIKRGSYDLAESKWANQFVVPTDGTRDLVIARYRVRVMEQPRLMCHAGITGVFHE